MNPAQRQPPTREQVVEHLKGQIALRKVSLNLTERKRALFGDKVTLAKCVYEPFQSAGRDERKKELLRYNIALEEASIEAGFLDLQIGDMKTQLEQLENALKQTESSILSPAQHGVMM